MKLHTSLSESEVYAALNEAHARGEVAWGVRFAVFTEARSNSHSRAFNIELGAADGDQRSLVPGATNQYGKPQKYRRVRRDPDKGDGRFAATWDEWGYFIAAVYRRDPRAVFGSPGAAWGYKSEDNFHKQTNGKFRAE